MRTKYIILSLLTAAGAMLTSCDDYLDVKPIGKMIPTEVSQFENLLNNVNTLNYFHMDNNGGCSYAALGDNLEISENQLNYNYTATFPNLDILAAYMFYEPMYNPTSTPFTWTYGYRAIGYFNNVIDGVSDIDNTSSYAKGIIAEARAARAWVYMNLALTYGPMYNPNGSNDTKVVPIRTSGDPTVEETELATTQQIFDLVKEDLDYAVENAPQTVGNPTRASKIAALGLRAEYYLYLRDWQNALADAQQAWQLTQQTKGATANVIYNFRDFYYEATSAVSPEEGVSPEYYMTFRGPDNVFTQTGNIENLLWRDAPGGSSTTKYYPSEEWKSIFDHEHDLRWKLFALNVPGYSTTVANVKYDDGVRTIYFRTEKLSTTESLTFPLLLLIKAEAEARTNNLSSALTSLNTLRAFRYDYGKDVSTDLQGGASMGQDQLLNEILTERRREQPLVSLQRTLDLKRYVYDSGKPWSKTTITHRSGSKQWSKNITDHYFQYLPIDNAILEYNPQWGIPQNETVFNPLGAK